MAMVMLVRDVQRRVVVWDYILLHRHVVLVRGFCGDIHVLRRRHPREVNHSVQKARQVETWEVECELFKQISVKRIVVPLLESSF